MTSIPPATGRLDLEMVIPRGWSLSIRQQSACQGSYRLVADNGSHKTGSVFSENRWQYNQVEKDLIARLVRELRAGGAVCDHADRYTVVPRHLVEFAGGFERERHHTVEGRAYQVCPRCGDRSYLEMLGGSCG